MVYGMQAQDWSTTCISLALVDMRKWSAFETAHSVMTQALTTLIESEDTETITKFSQARAQSLDMLDGYPASEKTGTQALYLLIDGPNCLTKRSHCCRVLDRPQAGCT